jgi:hypothetical protein
VLTSEGQTCSLRRAFTTPFTTMERESSWQGQFWEVDEIVWPRALRLPGSADREQTTNQAHAPTSIPAGRSASSSRGIWPCAARRRRRARAERVSHTQNPLGSCLSESLYGIVLPALVAALFRKGGKADDASAQTHACAMRDLQEWRAKARTAAWSMTSCGQKRSGLVAPSCFSFFLSGLLFAFIMTFPLTLRLACASEQGMPRLFARRVPMGAHASSLHVRIPNRTCTILRVREDTRNGSAVQTCLPTARPLSAGDR